MYLKVGHNLNNLQNVNDEKSWALRYKFIYFFSSFKEPLEEDVSLPSMNLGHGAWYLLPRFGSTSDAGTSQRRVRHRVGHLIFSHIWFTVVDTEIRHGPLCWMRVSYQNGNIQPKSKSQYSNTNFNIKIEILTSQTKS